MLQDWDRRLFLNKILLFVMVVIAVCDQEIEIEFNQNWIIDSDPTSSWASPRLRKSAVTDPAFDLMQQH